jgi:membrane peptidoglycan carboxypeptidase
MKISQYIQYIHTTMPNYLPNIHQLKKQVANSSLYGFAVTIFTFFVISAIIVSSLTFLGSWISYQWELAPDSEKILSSKSSESTKILAADGSLLFEMFDKENREIIETMETLKDRPVNKNYIPLHMQYAILALEDQNFYYNENGVPVSNILGAGIECLSTGGNNCRGASGIYQQLVKNKTLNDEQTIDRKVQEIISSYKLGVSEDLTHDQVLNLYLNTVGFGLNSHGAQKAAKIYFDKDIKDVTLPQACFLAGLPQIPPNRNSNLTDPNITELKYYLERKNICLDNLSDPTKLIKPGQSKAYISKEQLETYKQEEVKVIKDKSFKRYPHFVDFVIQEVAYKFLTSRGDKIVENVLSSNIDSNTDDKKVRELAAFGAQVYEKTINDLKTGGYTINTTLSPDIQGKLERSVSRMNYAGTGGNNGAGVVLDGPTGGILGMVGSRDFNDESINGQQNQIGQYNPYDRNYSSFHTVGSTMKVYDYSLAMNAGLNPGSILSNTPFKFGDRSNVQTNYVKGGCCPPATVQRSLAQSYNIGATKAAYIGGVGPTANFSSADHGAKSVEALLEWSKKMGAVYSRPDGDITSGPNSAIASAMAIGTEDLNLLSHAVGVNTIAQSGNLRTATPFVSIKFQDRDIYKERMALGDKAPYKNADKVIDPAVANQISKMLRIGDPNSLIRANAPVVDGWDFAGKTGTATREYRVNGRLISDDAVVELSNVQWSRKYTALLWLGNTRKESPYFGPLYDRATAEPSIAQVALNPLIRELHEGVDGLRFNTDGLSDFRGIMMTDKQKATYSQLRSIY